MFLFRRQTASLWLVLVLFFGFQFSVVAEEQPDKPVANKGVLDLRNWNFQDEGRLELAGEWAFYWQEFIEPAEISTTKATPIYHAVPGIWLGLENHGEILGKYGYATYRLKVLLPDQPADLAFYLKRVQSAYRLYVNGEQWMQSGVPGKTADTERAVVTRDVGSLKGAAGTLDIVVHVSNHIGYSGGGFFSSFTLGPEKAQHLDHMGELSRDVFLSGALFCLGAFLMILHLGRFRERIYFVLYVMSFCSAVYMMTVTSTVVELFPSIPYLVSERLSYVSAAFLIAFTYEFIHHFSPRRASLVVSYYILYQTVFISLFVIFWLGGLPLETIYIISFHLLVVSVACFVEIRYVLKRRVSGSWLIVSGVTTLVVFAIHDILHANGLVKTTYLGPYGILLLLFSYAVILALRVNDSITRNEQLAEAIRSLSEAVAIFDSRDHAVVWNDAYRQHLSVDAQKILSPGRSFFELVRADAYSGELPDAIGREEDYIRQRMRKHNRPTEAFEVERSNGWHLYREARTPDGGRVTLAANLSSQKAKEEELQAALEKLIDANEAKNSFLSNMSHELRTPLNAINGFSEMMVKGILGPINVQYRDYAGHIHRSGHHLLRLVTDMLDVVRIETGKLQISPEQVNIAQVLEDCFQMEMEKFNANNIVFDTDISQEIPPLFVDPIRVQQIVLNLLDNAIKFTDAGGRISASVRAASDGSVSISITDTGIGMAQKDIQIALQKFGQIRQSHLMAHDGLGLGLSIAKVLMELQGGELQLDSQLGEGTEVTLVFLPIEQAKAFFENPVLHQDTAETV
ncbi:sensor histidine kinase [Sneathiella sp.]|jgi:signal transduction histidine kinase|uniref:sensor histidine kinase n=1 Tax=Sneathiella sp. TaxID=1964365 RepID=UPI0039E444F8